jgi:hypothetical protein
MNRAFAMLTSSGVQAPKFEITLLFGHPHRLLLTRATFAADDVTRDEKIAAAKNKTM